MHLCILAVLGIAPSFGVVSGTHVRAHPFHSFLGTFSLEGFLPSLAFCHLELFDLIVIEDFRRLLLLVVPWFFFISIGAPLTLSFLCWFIAVSQLVEDGRKVHLEAVQENDQVEAIKVNDPLVDILLIEALATVFEEKLREAVHRPQNFCSECVFGRNSVFVDDAVFSTVSTKSRSLMARMLSSPKTNSTANV